MNSLWKNKISVLTGDYFLAKGLTLAVKNQDYDILKLISEVVEKIVEGEATKDKREIVFGGLNWDSALVQNGVARYIVEHG